MTDSNDFNRKSDPHDTPHSSTRRRILTALAAGAGAAVLLPEKWVKPVVDKVMTPVHAQATVACSAPAGCYTFESGPIGNGEISFFWEGGQGPVPVGVRLSFGCLATESGPEPRLIVVAASEAEASSLLGTAALRLAPIIDGPSLPAGCNFYDGGPVGLSDRRFKENVEHIGHDERTRLALYEFNYIGQPDQRYRGVMADEVEPLFPEAVITRPDGMKAVKYGVLGIPFEKVRSLH